MDEPNSAAVELGADARGAKEPPRKRRSGLPLVLAALGMIAGGTALGLTLWQNAETSREVLRLSTELAQLRVSLELYGRNRSSTTATDADAVAELQDRLTALETAAAANPAPVEAATTPAASLPAVTASGEDCLPPGMRLLVAMGDNYAICGQDAVVEVGMVDNGYITLGDGTTIPSGGSMPLPNSACTIGVTSSGDEGLTGYAEIRVSC